MASISALYEKVYNALQKVQDDDAYRKAQENRAALAQSVNRTNRIANIQKDISELLPYQSASAVYVDQSLLRSRPAPSPANREELEILYRSALTGNGNWALLYTKVSAGIAWLEHQKQAVEREPEIKSSNCSSPSADAACRKILESADLERLINAFKLLDEEYAPALMLSKNYTGVVEDVKPPLGKVTMSFPVTDGCVDIAKKVCGVYFLENTRTILIPAVIPAVTFLQVNSALAEKVMGGIRAYIISVLFHSVPIQKKIYYIDICRNDVTSLHALMPLAGQVDCPIANVAQNGEEVKKQLAELKDRQLHDPRQRLLIFRYRQEMFDHGIEPYLQWFCANANQYNLQIILVQELKDSETSFESCKPWYLPTDAKTLRSVKNKYIEEIDHHRRVFWYTEPTVIPDKVITSILEEYKSPPMITRYFDIVTDFGKLSYTKNRKRTVSLLYGVGESGEKYYLDLKGMDFSAYILGASRSGKSNLLNILITSAILNYHPDDLELWLVDFGRTEFKRYSEHIPPHAKYILIEKTTELVCSLVRKLIEEMERRGRIMSKYNVQEISELPDSVHMPRLLVMIDEFGAFKAILTSDSFDEKKTYRTYMEQLLRQGAKHGMNFIFSDQSFSDTYKALPEEGKEQIGLRVAMKASLDEMKSILEVRGRQLTDKEEMSIVNLPKYQVLFRSREMGGRLSEPIHVLYFNDEDKRRQLALIDRINAALTPNGHGRSDPMTSYVAREQLCINRDATPSFENCKKYMLSDIELWKKNVAYQDSDLLLYLGEPRNMTKVHRELLRNVRAENLVFYGSYEQNLEGIASVLYSASQSARLQNIPVEYWCDGQNVLTTRFLKKFDNSGDVITDSKRISESVQKMMDQIRNRTLKPQLIFLVGIDAVIRSIQDDLDEAAIFGGAAHPRMSDEDRERQRLRDMIAGKIAQADPTGDNVQSTFDMREHLNTVLDWAPKFGVHFVVVIQNEDELEDAAISANTFTHKAGFSSGVHTTQHFKFKRFIEGISESEMFGVQSGTTSSVYMPFDLEINK